MSKRALLVTTISGFVPQFEMNSVSLLQENGYEVHYATNYNYVFYGKDNSRLDGTGLIRHQIDFARSPYSKQTITAYRQLDKLLGEVKFDVIHCHTPIGSFLARMLGHKHEVPHIIYTAHGFHFFKGAPLLNWILYWNAERMMARYTDGLITINNEDYENAQKFKLHKNGKVYKIAGAGINAKSFREVNVSRDRKRVELGITDDFTILSVGELNKNKNQEVVIRALSHIDHSHMKYLICGDGESRPYLENLIQELNLDGCVQLLGYRRDVPEVCHAADIFAFPSFREGLPVSMMEAMAAGLPVIASRIRGNLDLIKDGINGFLLQPDDVRAWEKCINYVMQNRIQAKQMGESNQIMMLDYDKTEVRKQLQKIYIDQEII